MPGKKSGGGGGIGLGAGAAVQAKPPRQRASSRRPRRGNALDKDRSLPQARAEHDERTRIVASLSKRGSVRLTQSQAAKHLPILKPEFDRQFPGKRVVFERNRLRVLDLPREGGGLFGTGIGPSRQGWAAINKIAGDVEQVGAGIPAMIGDYGVAGVRDFREQATLQNARALATGDLEEFHLPFRRTTRLAARDLLGAVGAAERAIPTPGFLPESLSRDIVTIDPMTRKVTRGGMTAAEDTAAAKEFWSEDPLIALASVVPAAALVTRSFSQAAITRTLRAANPTLPSKVIRRIAAKESKMPGYAAGQGIKGGIEPRMLKGQYGEAAGRNWSRTPEGRALQRFYDRRSKRLDEKNPSRKFSTSQRAQRNMERRGRREQQQANLEGDLMDRTVHKAAGRNKARQEALPAILQGPKDAGMREAVTLALQDLRNTPVAATGSARAQIQMQLDNRIAALEKALADDWLDSPKALKAVEEMEQISAYMDEQYRLIHPWATDEVLSSRRNILVDRYAKQGLVAPGTQARGYFPHRDIFEDVGNATGSPAMAAKGSVKGVPVRTKWATTRANKLVRQEAGRVQMNPRVLSNTFRSRNRLIRDINAQRDLYAVGDEPSLELLRKLPDDVYAIRNPDAPPSRIDMDVRKALDDPESFVEELSPEFVSDFQKGWLFKRGDGPTPDWVLDPENVRIVPRNIARTRLVDVFPAPPQGLGADVAAIGGMLNSAARFVTIYTPYLGLRYVLRNTPQNMILLAISQPAAFKHIAESSWKLRRADRALYEWIKGETGSVAASAGFPDLSGRRIGRLQKAEKATSHVTRSVANWLGEVSDQPWRVASWMQYADKYGFKGRDGWRKLREGDDPAVVRVRDDISQKVREDMIDFDALSPVERESIARFLFIYPFIKGSAKWPFMYIRERPINAAVFSLVAEQHAPENIPGSVWKQGETMIAGSPRNLGWADPSAPARGTFETIENTIRAIGEIPDKGVRPAVGEFQKLLSPQYREVVKPYDDPLGIRRAFVPGYSTIEKIAKGGTWQEQVLRGLGVEVSQTATAVDERAAALNKDIGRIGRAEAADNPHLKRAFRLQNRYAKAIEGEDSPKAKVAAALKASSLSRQRVRQLVAQFDAKTDYENELFLGRVADHLFGGLVLSRARSFVNDQLRAKGLEPTD